MSDRKGLPGYRGMDHFYSYRTQGLHHKEPIPQDGPSSPGGGSNTKGKKQPPKKLPEYLKEFAH